MTPPPPAPLVLPSPLIAAALEPGSVAVGVALGLAAAAIVGAWLTSGWRQRQRLAEEEAQRVQEHDALLGELATEMVVIHDGARLVDVNHVFVRMFGGTRAEWRGRTIEDLHAMVLAGKLPYRIVRPDPLHILDRIRSQEPYEVVLEDGSGQEIPFLIAPRPIVIDGQPARGAVLQNLTERKRVEAAIDRAQTGFREMIETLPVGVAIHHKGIVRYANPAIATTLGYDREDVKGRLVADFIYPADRALVAGRIRALEEKDAPLAPAEVRMVHREGHLIFVETMPVRMIEFEGEPCNLVVMRDVTERRTMEERLKFAERMASVGTLAAGVAHEVNNPLAYVIGNIELAAEGLQELRAQPSDEGFAAAGASLDQALEGAERVRRIVQDLKTFSRADDEPGRPVDVREVLETAVRLGWNEIRHRAQLVRRFEDAPLVLANESRLAQVFLNLLINSAQAIPVGEAGANTIELTTGTDAHGRAMVEVRDTGQGMTADVQRHMFDPFFTTKPVGEGTGLGLSIVHGIVASLGGEITVDSEPGGGTRFRVCLPALADATPEVDAPARPAPSAAVQARVLVIDDEQAIVDMVAQGLRDQDVVTATRGRDGLALAESGDWDLILCDLMMPDLTGMEIYDTLHRTRPGLSDRIVFLTGGAFTPAARDFMANVPNARLEKPFSLRKLKEVVAERLRPIEAADGDLGTHAT